MKNFKKVSIIVVILWVAIIFYFVGYLIGHKNIVFETNYKPKITNLELKKPESVDFGVFWKAWNAISDKYVGTLSPQKMVNGAIKGMVEALGDPYSSFLDQTENGQLQQDLAGKFEGIGAELSKKDGKIIVIAPLADSPAEKAGIKAQDQILAIDGKDTSNYSLDEAVS
ncbi:MAG: Carboxyl-terminal protease, partial [Berkelbacteria bacterium GW2011_GWB1_38_5]